MAKKNEKQPEIVKLEVEVEIVKPETMYMRQHLGDGSLGKIKFDASLILPSMSLLVEVDKSRYLVSSQGLIKRVIEMHKSR